MIRRDIVETIVVEALRRVLLTPARWLGRAREYREAELYRAVRVLGAIHDALEIYATERVRDEVVAEALEAIRKRVWRAVEALEARRRWLP
jgi:LmbE family N-acetylglucosaminyl deacetylase